MVSQKVASQSTVHSTVQILFIVEIDKNTIEILLHVLPYNLFAYSTLNGMLNLQIGFRLNMTAIQFTISKINIVNNVALATINSVSTFETN